MDTEGTINIHENEEGVVNEVHDEEGVINTEELEEGTLYIEEELPQEFIDMFSKTDVKE